MLTLCPSKSKIFGISRVKGPLLRLYFWFIGPEPMNLGGVLVTVNTKVALENFGYPSETFI